MKQSGLLFSWLISALLPWQLRAAEDPTVCFQAPLPASCHSQRRLHVPSPDWRQQVIYGVLLDRFNDGLAANNNQGAGEYNPQLASHYSGGDLLGLSKKLDYIQALGATTVWVSPPTASKWMDPGFGPYPAYSGYHGYWPVNFKQIDKHQGTLNDFKDLSHLLHSKDMYLIQDAIVNHVAHFYHYTGPYNPKDKTQNFALLDDASPAAPTQPPFHQINLLNPEHKQGDVYHWTPPISNFDDPWQVVNYQLKLVNDINTENPEVVKALKEAYNYWITEVGVDGFRLDAAKHVELDFWHQFLHGPDGVLETAEQSGRSDFLTFAESWNFSAPFDDTAERELIELLGSPEKPAIGTVIGFPLFSEMNKVFNAGKPTRHLSYRLTAHMKVYPDPYLIPNFLDNHDVERFLAAGNIQGYKQALATLLTIPGVPIIFQGDEQGFVKPRRAMFAGGYGSEDDMFNQHSELFSFIQQLIALRKTHPALTLGEMKILQDTPLGPGVLAFQRQFEQQSILVLLNTSPSPQLMDNLTINRETGSVLQPLFQENIHWPAQSVPQSGKISLSMPARSILILEQRQQTPEVTLRSPVCPTVSQTLSGQSLSQTQPLSGLADKQARLQLVIDGNLQTAITIPVSQNGHWQSQLPIRQIDNTPHYFQILDNNNHCTSIRQYYSANKAPDHTHSQQDPVGDATGPQGRYLKPQHPAIGENMDIKGAKVRVIDHLLYLDLYMAELSNDWAYVNGFENVAFHLYFAHSNADGSHLFPDLNAQSPEGFNWSHRHKLFGFGNQIQHQQTLLKYEPDLQVDVEKQHIRIVYDSQKMGFDSWKDSQIYISTWDTDHEGELRPIKTKAGDWHFGGGSEGDPLILDQMLLHIPLYPNKDPTQ